jgi:DNA-binding transcriptional LysR family regulator
VRGYRDGDVECRLGQLLVLIIKPMPANRFGLELRHLQALDAVARHLSFNGAAGELGYTQSAVSQQIVALERLVGTRVFDRGSGPRPVRLTEPGRVLLGHAQAVLARVDAASADLTALVQGAVGELRIGTYQSVATRLLPAVLSRFREQWPRIDIQLFESGSHDDIDTRLERGAADLAFTVPPVPRRDLFDHIELLRDRYLLVVHPEHPLARAGSIELHDLADIDLVGYRVCRAHAQVERHLRSRGIEPRVVLRAEDNQLLQGLAAEGVGAAIMPLLAIDLQRSDTVVLDLSRHLPARRIGLLWHRERHLAPPAESFVQIARAIGAELAGDAESSLIVVNDARLQV